MIKWYIFQQKKTRPVRYQGRKYTASQILGEKLPVYVVLYLMLALVSVANFHFDRRLTPNFGAWELNSLLLDIHRSFGGEGGRV